MIKFISIIFIQILCGMEMDLFIPSFPELQQIFSLSPAMVQLTISVNFVALCICSLFAGALGDRYNRRHILLWGLIIFEIGGLCCVLAPSFSCLLLGRFLQGVGISAPAILSFPILLEDYPANKQPGIMGIINGVKTLAMAIAPLIGSFVNHYFSWQGNFSILFILGLMCLILCFFSIPTKEGNKAVSLSLRALLPLLKSTHFLTLAFALSILTGAYWLFFGMAPIFYMEGMQVPLLHFGYYQGSLSLTFALVCIISPVLFKRYCEKLLLNIGLAICIVCALLILLLVIFQINHPQIITATLILFSIGIVFPINILYPLMLRQVPNAQGRAAGLGQSILLLITAFLLELVGFLYNGQFLFIGATMVCTMMIAVMMIFFMRKEKWITFSS